MQDTVQDLSMQDLPINPAQQIEREFAQERAAALGRLGRAFEAALAALSEFDRAPCGAADRRQMRAALVAEASGALWQFIVQREACGLRDTRQVLRDYAVPPEVAARMGAFLGAFPTSPGGAQRPNPNGRQKSA